MDCLTGGLALGHAGPTSPGFDAARGEDRPKGPDVPELPTPIATRLQRPSWKDARLLIGVALVLLSVVGGATVLAAADKTVPVYAAASPLVPGQPLTGSDLTRVRVRLADRDLYVDGSRPLPADDFVLREVRAGELVPASALGRRDEVSVKAVSLPVDASAASSLVVGSVVDVWVSRRDPHATREAYTEPRQVLTSAVVKLVPARTRGLGVGTNQSAVQVLVPDDSVQQMIEAVDQGSRVTLVPVPGSPLGDAS